MLRLFRLRVMHSVGVLTDVWWPLCLGLWQPSGFCSDVEGSGAGFGECLLLFTGGSMVGFGGYFFDT